MADAQSFRYQPVGTAWQVVDPFQWAGANGARIQVRSETPVRARMPRQRLVFAASVRAADLQDTVVIGSLGLHSLSADVSAETW